MTTDNLIAVTFQEDHLAYQALSNLQELDGQGQIALREADVVERDQDGRLAIKDQAHTPPLDATAAGGFMGLLIGILGGPFGILIGGATGLMVGSLFDIETLADEGSALAAISNTIRPGQTVLLASLTESSDSVVDNLMAGLGGRVLRQPLSEVEAEVSAAERAQRAATREARAELRAEHRRARRDEVHARLDALKAKV